MANEQENRALNTDEFVKTDDKQTTADSGADGMSGVDFAESLPGGGEDNEKSSITAGDKNTGFDHRQDDDEKS